MSKTLHLLNEQQQKAVVAIRGPLLVLAGAGSGKTRVLTNRIAYMLEQGISPKSILAVTFTNKAAAEMRERVHDLVGPAAQEVWISTFHSTCLRMLRRDIEALGFSRGFNIYDTDDQKKVLQSIIKERGLAAKEHPPRIYASQIDDAKNAPRSNEELYRYIQQEHGRTSAEIFSRYQEMLAENNALDFNDLINFTIRAWQAKPHLLWLRQQQFQYIMVDEYQDTNPSQYALIQLLSKSHKNIMVVGDDDQSIYGFRGADVQNIFRFQKDFAPVTIIRLEQNYRSKGNILKAANAVISKNTHRMEKKMWTTAPLGPRIGSITATNQWEEAREVQTKIAAMVRNGRQYSDFAIIYRTNASSLPFEQEFMRAATPHVLVGARKFYERKEIRDLLCYFRVVSNPQDNVSFLRAIGVPKRGIGPKTIAKITHLAKSEHISMTQACMRWPKSGKVANEIKAFGNLIDTLQALAEKNTSPPEFCEEIFLRSGYRKALEREAEKETNTLRGQKSDAQRRLDNIEAFKDDLARWWEENKNNVKMGGSLEWIEQFLDRAALASPTEDLPGPEQRSVTLLTGHLAKGLEFPVVFVVGLQEGIFPHFRSMEMEEDIEEERRLLYVALTRAKEKLFLSYAKSQQQRDNGAVKWVQTKPSRFLKDIPSDLFESMHTPRIIRRKSTASFIPPRLPAAQPIQTAGISVTRIPNSLSELKVGTRVSHGKFGVGIIRKKMGASHNPKLRIEFHRYGFKTLLAQFANLEIISSQD